MKISNAQEKYLKKEKKLNRTKNTQISLPEKNIKKVISTETNADIANEYTIPYIKKKEINANLQEITGSKNYVNDEDKNITESSNNLTKEKRKMKKSTNEREEEQDLEPESISLGNFKKSKRKKQKMLKDETSITKSEEVQEDLHRKDKSKDTVPKKKKRKLSMYPALQLHTETLNEASVTVSPKKKKKLCPPTEEYKPGMLSNMLQIKKYGQLILPWDPSFGLDPLYSLPVMNEEKPKLKINPLFDLSKRQKAASEPANKPDTSVFVGNLPSNTTISQLKSLFKCCGHVQEFKIKRNKGFKKGNSSIQNQTGNTFAYLTFKSAKATEAALDLNGGLFRGHHIRVNLKTDEGLANKDTSVFVGNLHFTAQDDHLWKTFEECGEIQNVRIIRDSRTGNGKGYGYVNFTSADSVEAALKLDGSNLLDRTLRVSRHDSKVRSRSNQATVSKHKMNNKRKRAQKLTRNNRDNREASRGTLEKKNNRQEKQDEPGVVLDSTSTKEKKKKKKHKVKEIY